MNKFLKLVLAIPVLLAIAACSSNPSTRNGGDPELDAKARAALQQLFQEEPKARDVIRPMAKAVVVFPSVFKAGLIAGGQRGDGVMFDSEGKVLGYYRTGALSFGMQAGAQAYSEAIFLMTDTAIQELTSGAGLSLGVGPSFVLVDSGVAKSLTTTTLKADVYAFIFSQEGLMAGVGVQGQRIVKYD
ncbi:lipid-binding SYLF domain-containing protein [Achromobacter aloeverae]|uniref:Twin-arginine translocation pathway signal protein n=1 Tax=Achromobacter aloeverae TaxID=1750518 RepID=A0A4Q1HDY1_9BURK|nr:YSC84-related protein [Achromobacter aloeverae]RXN84518.1 twin-arginine translocation pathway signal protein [Achromobacter aloeverae]